MKVRLAGTNNCSLVDSDSLGFIIFFQGCNQHCFNCQNMDSHDINGGKEINILSLINEIKEQSEFIDNVILQGGEPLLQPEAVKLISALCKKLGFNIWLYTGELFPTIDKDILKNIDVVIDGPYKDELKGIPSHGYGGSTNQMMFVKKDNEWGIKR